MYGRESTRISNYGPDLSSYAALSASLPFQTTSLPNASFERNVHCSDSLVDKTQFIGNDLESSLYKSAQIANVKPVKVLDNGMKIRCCPVCKYSSPYTTNFKMHMLTHTNIKPFACNYCSYRSTQKGNLKSHVLRNHADMYNLQNIGQ